MTTSTLLLEEQTSQQSATDEQYISTFFCKALYDYQTTDTSSLSFRKGQIIEVLTKLDSGWWDGLLDDERGWFPSNYVTVISDAEAEALLNGLDYSMSQPSLADDSMVDMGDTMARALTQSDADGDWLQPELEYPGRSHVNGNSVRGSTSTVQHSDFWVPQVSTDGRIFYVNTKTGQQSRDLPREVAEESDNDIAGLTSQPASRAGTSLAGALNGIPEDPTAAGFGIQRRSLTPEPWMKRLADDGLSYYYVNKVNGQISWVLPESIEPPTYNDERALLAMQGSISVGSTSPLSGSIISANRLRSDSALSRTRDRSDSAVDRLSIHSDDSDVHPRQLPRDRAVSNASRGANGHTNGIGNAHGLNGLSRPSTSASSQPTPIASRFEPSRVEHYAAALQQSLAPPPPETPAELTNQVREAIAGVMSYLQAASTPRRPEQYKEVDERVLSVVKAVRNLLYVSATPNGHIPAHLYPRDGREVRPSLSSQTLQNQLKAAHRKVAGTLSKLVLSALAMQYDPGLSVSDKPNRMESDVMELERAVVSFVMEVQICQEQDRENNADAMPPTKRLHGVFSTANIGLGLQGAGAAASWKGFGFVPLEEGVRGPTRILHAETIAEVKGCVKSVAEKLAAMTLFLKRAEHDQERFRTDGQLVVSYLASLVSIVGDTNVAAHVDLEELYLDANPSPVQVQYAQSIEKGRILVRALEATLEALFEDSMSFLEAIQTFMPIAPKENEERSPYTRLETLISAIRANSNALVQCLDSLLTIGQDQSVMGRFDRESSLSLERPGPSPMVDGLDEVETLEEDVVDFELAFTRETPFRNLVTPDASSVASTTLYNGSVVQRGNMSIETAARSRSDSASEPATPTWGQYDPPNQSSMPEMVSPVEMPETLDDVPNRFFEDDEPAATSSKSPPRPAGMKILKVLGADAPQHYIAKLNAEAKPWYLRPNYDQSEILIDPDGGVKAGTPAALVERLTAHEHGDPTFIKNFLMTFKSFMTLDDLFDLLVQRFWIEPPPDLKPNELEEWVKLKQHVIRMRVLNTFKTMVIDDDILEKEDMYILAKMKAFVSNEEVVNFAAAKQLLILIERAQRGDDAPLKTTTTVPLAPPAPIIPKASRKLKLLDIDTIELARQLTLMEAHLYKKIRPVECLQRSRESKPGQTKDSITTIIQLSNRIANWVAESVLSKEDSKRRAAVVKHFISTADRCRSMQNFSTLAAIVAGLNTPPIRRLKRTWEQVGARFVNQLKNCEEAIDSNKNFNNYRSALARINPPCVPFIGVYLTTLTFINDGAEDKLGEHMINFRKRQKAAEVIQDIKRWQAKPYNYTTVPSVMSYLEESFDKYVEGVDYGDQFWNLSLEREPREREDEKMARLLQESGFL